MRRRRGCRGCLPAEVADEELVVDEDRDDVANSIEDIGVVDDGILEDFEELLGGEGLKNLAGILGSELGGGFEGGNDVFIGLALLRGGIHGRERRKRLLHRLKKKCFQICKTLTLEEDESRKKPF
ncbi:hypothetical protein MRB53_002093 [Persea americana]|uniref:Uncharacterized protein n=1 Tax=Persea americana TaxID=3435 RepID=A0ACC2MUH0_PERAE|nr:hypothetical protein MRB53_002093 [Persea americana]